MNAKMFPEWVPRVGQVIQVRYNFGDKERCYETEVSNRTLLNGQILLFVADPGLHRDLKYFLASPAGKWRAKSNLVPQEKEVEIVIV